MKLHTRVLGLAAIVLLVAACGAAKVTPTRTPQVVTSFPIAAPPTAKNQATTSNTTAAPDSTASATSTNAAPAPGRRSNPVPLGSAVSVGDGWTLKVTAYNPNATAEILAANQFNKPPADGMQYALVGVELAYTDAGTKDKEAPFLVSLKAVGRSNASYSWSDNFVVPPDQFDTTKDVFKGGSAKGNVAFTVTAADAPQLVLYAKAGFTGKDTYFATDATQVVATLASTVATAPPATTARVDGAPGRRSNPVPLGSAVSVGDGWTLKVTAYNPNATAEILAANQFNKPPADGMQYALVGVELAYTDAGTKDKEAPFLVSLKAVGRSNASYSWSDNFVVPPDQFDTTKDVFKGGSAKGNVAFTVTAADAPQLVLYAKAGFTGKDTYFATT